MISPTTLTTLPGSGLPSTPAATVVLLHGFLPVSPSLPAGLSKVPFSGVIFGKRMSRALAPAKTTQASAPSASAMRFENMTVLLGEARRMRVGGRDLAALSV